MGWFYDTLNGELDQFAYELRIAMGFEDRKSKPEETAKDGGIKVVVLGDVKGNGDSDNGGAGDSVDGTKTEARNASDKFADLLRTLLKNRLGRPSEVSCHDIDKLQVMMKFFDFLAVVCHTNLCLNLRGLLVLF